MGTVKALAGWLALMAGLFVLLFVALSMVSSGEDFTRNCNSHGGVVTRDWKCVQEVKL